MEMSAMGVYKKLSTKWKVYLIFEKMLEVIY